VKLLSFLKRLRFEDPALFGGPEGEKRRVLRRREDTGDRERRLRKGKGEEGRGDKGRQRDRPLPGNNAGLDDVFKFQDASAVMKIFEEIPHRKIE
jgi:hypothetical protein